VNDLKLYAETQEKSRASTDTVKLFSDNFKMPLIVKSTPLKTSEKAKSKINRENIRTLKTCSQKNTHVSRDTTKAES